jgi:hypothetical protein
MAPVAAAVAMVLITAACSGDDPGAQPRTTVPPAPTTTDPYAPPPVIDAAYLNRVLAALDQVVGDVVRMMVRDRALTAEAEERLRAVYADGDAAFTLHRDGLRQDAKEGVAGARSQPGNQATTVSKLISVRTDCIFAEVRRDFSAVVDRPDPEQAVLWVGLKPLDPSRDPKGLNPTPWMYVYDGFPADHTQPQDPCAGS